jgi:putative solute:sodium symporter small subunit
MKKGRKRMAKEKRSYWSTTLRLLGVILAIWAGVSLGLSIIAAPLLNHIKMGGYPLGFWFAQQGSIYVFIILIFVYARLMGRIDRKFDVHEESEKKPNRSRR